MQTIIIGSGSFVPQTIKRNQDFTCQQFYTEQRQAVQQPQIDITAKFKAITGIEERRYADDSMNASCMGAEAAKLAIKDAAIDAETIDQLIVAHNFGDARFSRRRHKQA